MTTRYGIFDAYRPHKEAASLNFEAQAKYSQTGGKRLASNGQTIGERLANNWQTMGNPLANN